MEIARWRAMILKENYVLVYKVSNKAWEINLKGKRKKYCLKGIP